MEATYNINQEEKRVEIRFPFPPRSSTRKELFKGGFTYDHKTQTWHKDHVVNAKTQAGRIVFNFNSSQA